MSVEQPVARPRSSTLPWVLLLLVLILGAGYLARDQILKALTDTSTASPSASTITSLSGPGVLRRIQDLNNLETVAFHIETVVTSDKPGNWYALWQDKQQALFIANGTVTAGIDLGQLKASDVEVSDDGQKVRIQLPPAKVLQVNLEQTRTYDIETGVFGLVGFDPKLMEQAQVDAKTKINQTACASDILKFATNNGQRQIEDLFSLMDIQVTVIPDAVPQCI